MLSGGTETIMKVMGGGGGDRAPDGYNETQSMLSGGIEPILKVEGGGGANTQESNISIRYVSNYELDTDALAYYNNNIPNIINDVQPEMNRNKSEIKTKDSLFRRKLYHYIKDGNSAIADTPTNNLRGNKTEIIFIPKNIREVIVLPPVDGDPYNFFKQLAYLKDSKYILDNNKLANNIFVISLKPFISKNSANTKPKLMNLTREKERLNKEKERLNKTSSSKNSDIEKFYDFWAEDKYDDTFLNIGFIYDRIKEFNSSFENRTDDIKEKNDIDKLKFCISKMRFYRDKYVSENPDEKIDDIIRYANSIDSIFNSIYTSLQGNNQSGGQVSNSELLEHYYLNFKNINYDTYYVVNDPYTLIYPKKVGFKEGIFFTTDEDRSFPKPLDEKRDLLPTDNEEISDNSISSMAYTNSDKTFNEDDYYIISNGSSDVEINNTSPTFDLKKNIAILQLGSSDIPIVAVDVEGQSYRIRVPELPNDSDTTYKGWSNKQFTKHEKKLLDDLNFIQMANDNNKPADYIANFLYYLVHYKCFNDTSLLTRNECNIVRDALKDLYKYKLYKIEKRFGADDYENIKIKCSSAGVGKEGKIICKIKKVSIEIDKPEGWNGTITDQMKREAFNIWSKQNKIIR
jgi:hypothetical protein